jgi:hypothetical protein
MGAGAGFATADALLMGRVLYDDVLYLSYALAKD